MNDRPAASNGKRYVFWGTLQACPVCGECLCFSCHPQGPCVDERDACRTAAVLPASLLLQAAAAGRP